MAAARTTTTTRATANGSRRTNGVKPKAPPASVSRIIDVDAHRAARFEQLGPPPVLRIDGRDYELPPEMPAQVITAFGALTNGDLAGLDGGLRALLGDAYDAVIDETTTFADLEFVITAAMESYGMAAPES
jgi:hypothetical protein